jgi:hypothetical protein
MRLPSQVTIGWRIMWWPPRGLTRWWLPKIWTGSNEWCEPSVCFTVPPLGCLIIFHGPKRTMPCDECWADMQDWCRADYLPGGWLEGGVVHQDRFDAQYAEAS